MSKKRKRTIDGEFCKIFEEVFNQKLLTDDGIPLVVCDFFFQYNFIARTHVQLTFTKDNPQQNENYNLKLTKKTPNPIKTLVVTKIKWERHQLSKQNFIPLLI